MNRNIQEVFFPNIISAWDNKYPRCTLYTLSLYKMKLRGNQLVTNMYFSVGCGPMKCIISRNKLQCSELKHDLFMNNLIQFRPPIALRTDLSHITTELWEMPMLRIAH